MIYLVVLIILLVGLRISRSFRDKYLQDIYARFEDYFYLFHKALFEHKEKLYRLDKALPILFAHKTSFFQEKQHHVVTFQKRYKKLYENSNFFDEIIADTPLSFETFTENPPPFSSAHSWEIFHITLKRFLQIMTLGAINLFDE